MKIIKSKLFERYSKIKFAFSTKIGLEREAPYFFNMSKSVGDDEKFVNENWQLFFSDIGLTTSQIAFQKQVHGDSISIVSQSGFQGESDAMVTTKRYIGLAVSTADCTPIFIYDKSEHIVAAIHSGWRSTKEKILWKTLAKLQNEFNSKSENLIAYIGPCISQKNYEVDQEFGNYFESKYLRPNEDKYLLDLKSANKDMLIEFGVKPGNIEVDDLCSFEENYLHSYRREGKVSGRALGVIALV